MESSAPLKIPLKAVLIDIVGALLCGGGVYGLVGDAGPTKMHVALAVMLIVTGVGLMGYAMTRILLRIREASRGQDR